MIEISVIIPSYKPGVYIYECLDSIANQRLGCEFYEVLIILNGDKEPYYSGIDAYLHRENINNARILYTETPGVSRARNIGLDNALGKYICFIDDDDLISEDYLQAMYDIAVTGYMPLSYNVSFIDDISKPVKGLLEHVYEKYHNKKFTLLDIYKYTNTVYRKLIDVNIIGPHRFDVKLQNSEDALFMFSISNNIRKIAFAGREAVYYQRMRKNSLSRSKKPFIYRIKNAAYLIGAFSRVYFSKPFQYNFLFFMNRMSAVAASIIRSVL